MVIWIISSIKSKIERIQEFTKDLTFVQFDKNRMAVDAVI
jgi:uncharacterized protein with HEPN domain